MKPQEINYLKTLDPLGLNGTIQTILMDSNINEIPFVSALQFILSKTLEEKKALQTENTRMRMVLQHNNPYTSQNLGLEE